MQQKRKEKVVTTVLFFVAISVLIATGLRTETGLILGLLSKSAFALLVAVVIKGALVFLYREDLDPLYGFRDLGMEQIHYPLTDQNLRKLLKESRTIDVMKTWFPESVDIERGLEEAIKENRATVRLLLCQPYSAILTKRSADAKQDPWEGPHGVYRAVEHVRSWLVVEPRADVQIACYDDWPGCPMIRYREKSGFGSSRRILMGFYFRGAPSPAWPWIRVKDKSELGDILDEQFKELWAKAELLDNPEKMSDWLERNQQFRSAQPNLPPPAR